MSIFNIFKKRKSGSTFPENELEQSLILATSNVSSQKDFYQKLMWNQLYVLTAGHYNYEEGVQILENETTVQLVTFENGQIPVFTSTNRIFDNGVLKQGVAYLCLKGQDLFGIVKGATYILNPYSDYRKELTSEEIENLMNGTIYDKIDKFEIEKKKFEEFNELFNRAGKRQEGLILLDGYRIKKLNTTQKLKLEESVRDFQKCLELVPDHWQSMVLLAKAYQRLERHSEALVQLESALKIDLENHTIPMEAALESMHLKDIDKALFYSEESLKRKPNDFALLGNHAMNLLIAQKDLEAKATIEKAIKIQPNDPLNRNIESIVRDVISGNHKRPTFEDAIK